MRTLAGSVSRIWSRPDQASSQIISVGAGILDPEQAAMFALENDGSLILLRASEALAGQYQCRIATQVWGQGRGHQDCHHYSLQESIEVAHSVTIVPDTEPGMMESQRLSSGASALLNSLNFFVISAVFTFCCL